ncbi:MAG: hypothetical protein AB1389_02125 [Campylobacterota bacterium]
MFTLIKRIQEFLAKLKKNKGLWFTTITIISIMGIFICMYIIMTMTDRVSTEVYKSMAKNYELNLDNKLAMKQKQFNKMVIPILNNRALLTAIETNNIEQINQAKNQMNEELVKNGFLETSINFISTASRDQVFRNTINSIITGKMPLGGFEVLQDGVFLVYLYPLIKDGSVYGVIEIKDSVHLLRELYTKENSEYTFILDKKMLSFIALETRTGKYKDINQTYTFENARYDTRFATLLADIDEDTFKKFVSQKFLVSENYYRAAKKIDDINGVEIGLIIVGENTDLEGGFVNIADNMTKTVTMVALGLIISIILFLF